MFKQWYISSRTSGFTSAKQRVSWVFVMELMVLAWLVSGVASCGVKVISVVVGISGVALDSSVSDSVDVDWEEVDLTVDDGIEGTVDEHAVEVKEGEVGEEKVNLVADFVSGSWMISSGMAVSGVGRGTGFAVVGERSCLDKIADAEIREGEEGEGQGNGVGREDD